MKEILIGKNESNQRLDKLLIKFLPNAGKGFLYKMMRKKNITLNGKKCEGNEILNDGDILRIWMADDTIDKFSGKAEIRKTGFMPDIIYEDEDILAFNKPAGILSQRASSGDISINDMLLEYLIASGQVSEEQLKTFRPSICNRLDRNTSGIIVCGKSLKGLQNMASILKDRSAHKDYIAFVEGEVKAGDRLKGCISKDNRINKVSSDKSGDYIETEYKPLWTDGKKSILMVRLITGKTHQIRFHLASAGHPIIGDVKYGNGRGAARQLLHAYRLSFPDGRIITADLPEDMKWELGNPGAFEDLPSKI